ncbi:hypothetical protein KKE45_03170 [Patescibacteria group bacterium]|nr:hypothetical protein [Patescibacteria group bacterium]
MANKKKYCFDANIIVKLVIEEDYSDKAKTIYKPSLLLSQYKHTILDIPTRHPELVSGSH